jgi:hypothetical protein
MCCGAVVSLLDLYLNKFIMKYGKQNQARSRFALESEAVPTILSTVRTTRPCGSSSSGALSTPRMRSKSRRDVRKSLFECGGHSHNTYIVSTMLLLTIVWRSVAVAEFAATTRGVQQRRLESPTSSVSSSKTESSDSFIHRLRGYQRRELQGADGDGSDGGDGDIGLVEMLDDDMVGFIDNNDNGNDNEDVLGDGILDFVEDIVGMFENEEETNNSTAVGEAMVEVLDEAMDFLKNEKGDNGEPKVSEAVQPVDEELGGVRDEDVEYLEDQTKDKSLAPVLVTGAPIEPAPKVKSKAPTTSAPRVTSSAPVPAPRATAQPSVQRENFNDKTDGTTEGEDDIFDKDFYDKGRPRPESSPTSLSVVATLLGIAAMIFTAWQMSDNPDGVFASMCRLIITCLQLVYQVIMTPCRKCMPCCFPHHAGGNGYHEPYGHMRVSTMDYGYKDPSLELS